jgi:hypothetical protein
MRRIRRWLGIGAIVLLAGCGPAVPIDASGVWDLEYTNIANNDFQGTMTYLLSQDDITITGFAGIGGICGDVSGRMVRYTLTLVFELYEVCGDATFYTTGTVLGDSFEGTYTASGGGKGPVVGRRVQAMPAAGALSAEAAPPLLAPLFETAD